MPAKLVVVSGEPQGKEFWIEEEVLRIGSAANCGVRLNGDDVPAHAATLEYRGGRYSIHNRTGTPLVLAGETLADHAFAEWDAGTELNVGSQTVLRLLVDGDPAPSRQEAQPYYEDDADEGAATEETAAPRKSKVGQFAVILLCGLGFAFLLLYDQLGLSPGDGPNGVKRNEFKDFHGVIEDLVKVENGETIEAEGPEIVPDQAAYLRKVLQRARVAELRRDRIGAKRLYGQIRDQLFRKKQLDNPPLTHVEDEVWSFVVAQLGKG